jgi:hypothetical protein
MGTEMTLRNRQSYFNGLPEDTAEKLGAQGVIVLALDQNGAIGIASHGVNHAKAVELLSVGIHLVLGQHDAAVAAGAAGEDAQKRAAEIAKLNEEAA